MDFLKALFPEDGGALTYEQLAQKIAEQKMNLVDLTKGGYVSQAKFDDKVNGLKGQVADLQGQITQRDADLSDLQGKLTAAQADAGKLTDAQTEIANLRTKYDTDKAQYEQRLSRQAYEFAVRERANALHFTSRAAKSAFIAEAIKKDFKQDGEALLGYEDFVNKYKADDPGAFKADDPAPAPDAGEKDKPTPTVVLPSGGKGNGTGNAFNFHFNGVRPMPTANNE